MNTSTRTTLGEGLPAGSLRRTAVSHLGLAVPDLAAAVEFYGRILGLHPHDELADGLVRLGWGSGHHALALRQGAPAVDHVAFEVRDEGGLERLEKRLHEAGAPILPLEDRWLDEALPGTSGFATTDPDGLTIHFHGTVRRAGEHAADTGRRPIKYQHVTLATRDIAARAAFFTDVCGFRISDQLADGRFVWLRSDRDHHTLALVDSGSDTGLDHYSYDLAEWEDFKTWCDRLTDEGVDVSWGPGRHGPGNNLFVFFDDPAGHHIELSAEMEKFHDDRVTYTPRRWEPIPASVNLWGGQLASWRRTSEGG